MCTGYLESSGAKIMTMGPIAGQLYERRNWEIKQQRSLKINFMFLSTPHRFVFALLVSYLGKGFKVSLESFLELISAETII